MTTPAQTTLQHAADLLEADAKSWRECCNADPQNPDWKGEPDAHAAHDDALCTALELRLLARSMQMGHAAVPPAPTFEGERNEHN